MAMNFYNESKDKIDNETIVKINTELQIKGKENAIEGQAFGKKQDGTFGFMSVGGSGDIALNQVTKLGVIAPKDVVLEIPHTEDFKRIPIEVLKFKEGLADQTVVLCEFDNKDASDFEPNDMVEFDGAMKLKTSEILESVQDETWTDGFLTITKVDQSRYVSIESFEVI